MDVEGILRGIHRVSAALGEPGRPRAQVLASGVALPWALRAQELLGQDWGVDADVWSVTSWNELRRDALAADEHNLLNPEAETRTPYVVSKLAEVSRAGGRGVGLHARGAGPDRAVGADPAAGVELARRRRLASPTPGARPAGSSTSTPSRSW